MVEIADPATETVAYARVSSRDQNSRLYMACRPDFGKRAANDIKVDWFVPEVGSGLNDQRKQLAELLRDPRYQRFFVEHREGLARFGVQQFEHALAAYGRHIGVFDDKEIDDDLVRDMIDGMTSVAAQRYSRRRARQSAERAVIAMDGET